MPNEFISILQFVAVIAVFGAIYFPLLNWVFSSPRLSNR